MKITSVPSSETFEKLLAVAVNVQQELALPEKPFDLKYDGKRGLYFVRIGAFFEDDSMPINVELVYGCKPVGGSEEVVFGMCVRVFESAGETLNFFAATVKESLLDQKEGSLALALGSFSKLSDFLNKKFSSENSPKVSKRANSADFSSGLLN